MNIASSSLVNRTIRILSRLDTDLASIKSRSTPVWICGVDENWCYKTKASVALVAIQVSIDPKFIKTCMDEGWNMHNPYSIGL